MPTLFQFLVDQFYTNQFMTAAVVTAPVAALTYAARNLPGAVMAAARRTLSMDVRFNSDMHNYERVQAYLLENIVSRRFSKTFKYHADENWRADGDVTTLETNLGVGYGSHFGWWRGKPVWISRSSDESSATERFKEHLEVTFLSRNVTLVDAFVQDLERAVHNSQEEPRVGLYVNDDGHWRRMVQLPLRALSTVLTNDQQGQRALQHVVEFVQRKQWYRARGLPHHTGILLEGVPGTGKSSLIHALASETKRVLYYLNLGAVTEEKQITSLMASRPRWDDAILVIEDIDASGASVNRDSDAPGTVTLSTLLNVLDGILSPDGLVVVATTNHVEALDPALVRPGRFDLRMRLEALQWPQFAAMAALFELPPQRVAALRAVYLPTPGANLRALILDPDPEALEKHFAQRRAGAALPPAPAPTPVVAPPTRKRGLAGLKMFDPRALTRL